MGIDEPLIRRLREAAFILVLAVSCYAALALFTYHATDPSWSFSGDTRAQVQNLGGQAGALFSDLAFTIFGVLSYLLPLILAYSAWRFILHPDPEKLSTRRMLTVRCVGLVLFMIGATGFISAAALFDATYMAFPRGGVIGELVARHLLPIFSLAGSQLILIAMSLGGLTLFTGFSWVKFSEAVGQRCLTFMKANHAKFKAARTSSSKSLIALPDKTSAVTIQQSAASEAKESLKTKLIKKVKKPALTRPKLPKFKRPKDKKAVAPQPVSSSAPQPTPRTVSPSGKAVALPSLHLLEPALSASENALSDEVLTTLSELVELRLQDFGVVAKVVAVQPGPVVTRFELDLAAGIKVSKVSALAKDLARSLSVVSVRVVEVIPGKSYIGIELPNPNREIVRLSEVIASRHYQQAHSPLSLALGKDIAGHAVVVDLQKMPHLLVAGTTGSGKSVGLNAMLLSILYKASPEQVRLIMVDPKMLELSVYDGIPHLLCPVVTDMKEASNALRWCVAQMELRYQLMAALGVRNLAGYNQKVSRAIEKGEPIRHPLYKPAEPNLAEPAETLKPLPYIVVCIDEYADMMMVVGKKVEELIARIAQKARAAGIHLMLATQRPSVDVVTGLIKANIPTRIAFQVSSKIDSRTILDQQGAEQLLGHGDMLYLPPGTGVPIRVHGAFVDDDEVHRVVSHWKDIAEPEYDQNILEETTESFNPYTPGEGDGEQDALYDQAVQIVTESRRASISYVQRRLKIGYNRSARLLEDMEQAGVVTAMESNGQREVLAPPPVTIDD